MGSVAEIQSLLHYFQDKVPDKESNRYAQKFANDTARWSSANTLFESIQEQRLSTVQEGNKSKERQYYFEQACAKTLYNITGPTDPFDPDSPYWVLKNALLLAKALEAPFEDIVNIVAAD